MLNPIDFIRKNTIENLNNELNKLDIKELKNICKKYMPDPTRKTYRLKDKDKVIIYIIFRASKLADKGKVFVNEI
jgi:hypothetical protein